VRNAALLLLALAAVATPAALAARDSSDGTVTVVSARGTVVVQAKGAVIGRLDSGTLEITDLSPDDDSDPVVVGQGKEKLRGIARTWRGQKLTFRLIGGSYRVVVKGVGIDVSAVGRGFVLLKGDGSASNPGRYSLTGDDCSLAPERCQTVPDRAVRFELGGNDKDRDKDRGKSSSLVMAP
jgi:hypothetical protein